MKLISTTTRKGNLNRPDRFVAFSLSVTDLIDYAQRDSLPVRCTADAHFENGVWMDWVLNTKRSTAFSVLNVAIKHFFVTEFLQATMIPAHHRAYVFLSLKDFQTLRRIGRYRTAFDSVRGIFPKLSSSVVAKRVIACASGCFSISFFNEKRELISCTAVLRSCAIEQMDPLF